MRRLLMSNASKQLCGRLCANDMHLVPAGSKRSKVEILERNCVHYFKTCQDVKPFALQADSCAGGRGEGRNTVLSVQEQLSPPPVFCSNNLDCQLFFTLCTPSLELYRHLAQVACTRLDNSGVKPILLSAGGNVSVRRTNCYFFVLFFTSRRKKAEKMGLF